MKEYRISRSQKMMQISFKNTLILQLNWNEILNFLSDVLTPRTVITKSKLLETKISKENYYIEVDEIREELRYRKKLLNKLESDGSDKRDLMDKLRHEGFKLAGVEQMIVSLWSVPDKETMELMTLFYEDLTLSLNPVTSFEKAQKQMREAYPTRPDLWAGFVLVR